MSSSVDPKLLLQLLGENYPNGSISLIDKSLKFIYTNGSGYKAFGLDPETFIGKNIAEVLLPEVYNSIKVHLEKIFKGEMVVHEVETNDLCFLNSYKPLVNESGQVNFFVLTSQDITQFKALEVEHKQLQTVVQKSVNEIYILDPKTFKLEYVNEASLRNLKYSLDEIRDLTLFDIKTQYDKESFVEFIRPILSGEKDKLIFETTNRRSNGSFYPVEVHLQLIMHGGKSSIVTIVLDISSKRQYEQSIQEKNEELAATVEELNASTEELRDQNKKLIKLLDEKESLFKELHHRIKNNLQMVLSLLFIKSQNANDPKLLDFIKDTKARIVSISLLHEHLLQLKSINTLNVNEYLSSLIRTVMNSYKGSGHDYTLHYDIASFEMHIDQIVNIGLITNEILSNIYKHAYPHGRGGPIEVHFSVNNNVCRFEIGDRGVGKPHDVSDSKTYGSQLIQLFADQLKAKLTVTNSQGTRYSLEFTKA